MNRGYLHPFWNGGMGRYLYGVGELPRTVCGRVSFATGLSTHISASHSLRSSPCVSYPHKSGGVKTGGPKCKNLKRGSCGWNMGLIPVSMSEPRLVSRTRCCRVARCVT